MLHPLKRARAAANGTMEAPPAAVSLTKSALVFSDRPSREGAQLSPGAPFGCRVAIQSPTNKKDAVRVFLATGTGVYTATVPQAGATGGLLKGKEGVCIPAIQSQPVTAQRITVAQHIAEVQSIQIAEVGGQTILGSIDALGRATLVRATTEEGSAPSPFVPANTYQLTPQSAVREPGWAGLAISRQQADLVATAQHFDRELTVYENQIPIRTIGLHACPTSLMFLPPDFPGCNSGSVIAAAHGPHVGIWDIRAAGFGALVTQLNLNGSTETLYTVQCSEGSRSVIGAAGAERSVGVWEPRKWTYLSRWNNCLKYEVFSMHFSTLNPEYCYVGGADYEVLCGTWNRTQRSGGGARTGKGSGHRPEQSDMNAEREAAQPMAFRGDARWLGLARAQSADILAGLSSSGHVFVATMDHAGALSGV